MSFGEPVLLLLLLVPALSAAGVLATRTGTSGLPGVWAQVVEQPLRRYLGALAERRHHGLLWLCAAIACFLVLALGRPVIERSSGPDYGNIGGRVIVIDMGDGLTGTARRLAAHEIIKAGQGIPTALVAVAAEAYTVVPLTTDQQQLDRYLQVLEPHMMPVPGRALHRGVSHAEQLLARAETATRQIVLVAGAVPPGETTSIAASDTTRIVVPTAGQPGEWDTFARAHDADLALPEDAPRLAHALRRKIAKMRHTQTASGALDLTPFFTAAAMLLWLGLFRKRGSE
ncbi:MAG: hypothetical protein AAF409_13875 [Pseudomonadota bacterium]